MLYINIFWKVCQYILSFFRVPKKPLYNIEDDRLYAHNYLRECRETKFDFFLWNLLEMKIKDVKVALSKPVDFSIIGFHGVITRELYEQFNDNIEILKKINEPVINALGEIIDKDSYRFETMMRELYSMSTILLKIIKDYRKTPLYIEVALHKHENCVQFVQDCQKLVDEMTLLRSTFTEFGHVRFDD